jgi:hypothetical protein
VYSLRKTRATIWSGVDDLASRVALGHAPSDSHTSSYVDVPNTRLFKLVGIELNQKKLYTLLSKVG